MVQTSCILANKKTKQTTSNFKIIKSNKWEEEPTLEMGIKGANWENEKSNKREDRFYMKKRVWYIVAKDDLPAFSSSQWFNLLCVFQINN